MKHPCDEGVVLHARGSPKAAVRGPWVLASTILGSSLAFIDGTVVNVALPSLQRDLNATMADVQWVVEAYSLLFSALVLVGGSLGDRYGRRRTFAIGIVVFGAASALCALAGGIRALIAARVLQGIGAALLVPGSLALIAASYPQNERGRAIGAWSGFSAMTAAMGPVLGGWLIDHLSWRWAFLLNLPLAAAALAILFWRVPESRDPEAPKRLDWLGAGLATAGLAGVVYGLIEAPRRGESHAGVAIAIAAGVACLVGLLGWESVAKAPMLPLSLFRSRTFAGANLLTLGLYAALSIALFLLPLDLIQVHHYSATAAGAALLPFILLLTLLSRWSGGLLDRFGARRPLIIGPTIAAAGLALLARPGVHGGYWTTFFPAVVLFGLGMAVTVAPLTTTVMNGVPVEHAGVASGVNNAVARVAGLVAIAFISVPLLHVFHDQIEHRLRGHGLRPGLVAEVQARGDMLAGAQAPPSANPAERVEIEDAIAESFVAGFRSVMLLASGGSNATLTRPASNAPVPANGSVAARAGRAGRGALGRETERAPSTPDAVSETGWIRPRVREASTARCGAPRGV